MPAKKTEQIQDELALYCRQHEVSSIPGVREDRLDHYRRLMYNIMEDALVSAYPICRSILVDSQWYSLVDDFVRNHGCKHPQLFRMPEELIEFVRANDYTEKLQIPYLIDLLLFEWIEIEVHTMPDHEVELKSNEDLWGSSIVFSPYMKLIQLDYPVHLLKNQVDSFREGEYFYLVYREQSGTVQYLTINHFSFKMLQSLMNSSVSLELLLENIRDSYDKEVYAEVKKQSLEFLTKLKSLHILL